MEHLRDNFGNGPISQVPASWFNAVSKFINNLVPGIGVRFEKHLDGGATVIDVEGVTANDDPDELQPDGEASAGTSELVARADHVHPLNYPPSLSTDDIQADGAGQGGAAVFGDTEKYADLGHSHPINVAESGTPSDVVKSDGTASLGSDTTYARTDHVHKMPSLAAADITYNSTTVGATLTNHETRIETLEQGGGGHGTVTSVDNVAPVNGNVQLNALTTANYSTTLNPVYQPKSAKLTALNSALNDNGTMPVTNVYDSDCTASCLAICDHGAFGHSHSELANNLTFGGDWPTLKKISECFTVIGSGASAALRILISKISGSSSDTNKVVTTNANGELALNSAGNGLHVNAGVLSAKAKSGGNISVTSDGIGVDVSGTGFVKATNGVLSVPESQPLTLPSGSGFVKSNGSTISTQAKVSAASEVDFGSGVTNVTTANIAANAVTSVNGNRGVVTVTPFPGFGGNGSSATASHSDHTHVASQVTDLGDAATKDVDVSGGVMSYKSKLSTLDSSLTASGKVPFSAIDGSISGHSGNCLMYVNGNGVVGHVGDGTGGNDIYDLVAEVNRSGNKIITDADVGAGIESDASTHNIKVKCKPNGGISVDANGIYFGGESEYLKKTDAALQYAPIGTVATANAAAASAQSAQTKADNAATAAGNAATAAADAQATATNAAQGVMAHQTAITSLQTDVATHTTDIATNASNIATNTANIATNTSNIESNTSQITTIGDEIDTLDTRVRDLEESISGGITGSVDIVTGVTWTGSALTMTRQTLSFNDGFVTGISNAVTSTIDTAVLFDQV